jgi:metallo-beta-lactamase family protein
MLPCEGPLYTQKDAVACMGLFRGKNYGAMFDVVPGVRAQFLDAGHVLGAAMVILEINEAPHSTVRFAFSGDLGRDSLPIIRNPSALPAVHYLLCESTYGDRAHEDIVTARHRLQEVIVRTAKRGGKVLIPAFSLERTQEIVYDLHLLWDEKAIPPIPIIIDSPLASRVTEIFLRHPECYDKDVYDQFLSRGHNPFQFSLVRFTASVEESKALNSLPGPAIIMAGSGMCEAGRIRHHLRNGLEDPRNTVVAVGYMAENTLGRRIIEPSIRSVRIFDEEFSKKAEVVVINAYSAHADRSDLDRFIGDAYHLAEKQGSALRKLFLVHGEERAMLPLKERLKELCPSLEVILPEQDVAESL